MDRPLYLEILKIAVAPFVAFLIAVFGWVITAMFTESQQNIAREKNIADIEISKTNAAISFLQHLEKIPAKEPEKRARAIAVAIPVLPTEFAFDLALDSLEHDVGAIATLIQRAEGKHWNAFETRLSLGPSYRTAEFVEDIVFDPHPQAILKFLYSKNLIDGLEEYILQSTPVNVGVRTNAIVNYFKYLRSRSDESKQESLAFARHTQLVESTIGNSSIPDSIKQAVALSACISFINGYGDDRDKGILAYAADYFWSGISVSEGELPREDSLRGYVYRHAFHYQRPTDGVTGLPVLTDVSQKLLEKIESISDFNSLTWEQVRLMTYSYVVHTPRDTESPFVSFLVPEHAIVFWIKVLEWAYTKERRVQLGREINSLSGHAMFRNIGRDPARQLEWAKLTLQFYENHYSSEWYPAKIMHDILHEYPDLRSRIKAKDWGISVD